MSAATAKKPATTGPAPRVSRARDLTTQKVSGPRDAIAGTIGKVLTAFSLAEIAILQEDADRRDELPMFVEAPKKPWQTFANFTDDNPDKDVTAPLTFATDVKMGLAALLIGIADLVNSVGKLPANEPLTLLAASQTREGGIIRLLVAVEKQMKPHLRVNPMNCELGYPSVFRQKFTALVDDKKYVDPGAELIAHLFFNFLKVIAWHAAVIAYEHEHLTLNRPTLFAILAQLAASVPETEMHLARDVLSYVRDQVEKWAHAQAQVKAKAVKKPTAAGVKAAAAKTAPAGAKSTAEKVPTKTAPAEANGKRAAATKTAPATAPATAPGGGPTANGDAASPAATQPVGEEPVVSEKVGGALELVYDDLIVDAQ
jgi:hypothetical protein